MHGGWGRLDKAMLCRCGLTFISKEDKRKEDAIAKLLYPRQKSIIGNQRRVSKDGTKKGGGEEEEEKKKKRKNKKKRRKN